MRALLLVCLLASAPARAGEPPNVEFPSDGKMLKGWLYKPQNNHFPAPAVIWNHGSDSDVEPFPELIKTYLDHGYVFFLPVRRYHRPSGNGPTIMEKIDSGWLWQKRKRWIELNEEENRDVFAALEWLKKQPYVDAHKIVVSGVSFGGVQTLLAAERGGDFRAAVSFAPAAISWGDGSNAITERMESAVKHRRLPLFIVQANNDFSLAPAERLGPLLEQVQLAHQVKVFPDFGTRTPGMGEREWHGLGHHAFAVRGGSVWGPDVFKFLDDALK
jgi:carboxymethylenebutenolidase